MSAFIIILSVVLVLFAAFILSVRGERDPRVKYFTDFKYTHRGFYDNPKTPENSMKAFSKALDKGYGIELDVRILKDGTLVVFHDANLNRMTGADVKIETLTKQELKNYTLLGTTEQVPEFKTVLELIDSKVPLLIELKPPKDVDRLCRAVTKQLASYKGKYAVCSFDPRCVKWFKENSPNTLRGQISQNYFKQEKTLGNKLLMCLLGLLIFNFITKPNFISYRFEHRNDLAPAVAQRLWKLDSFVWTAKSKEEALKAEKEGKTVIFENFEY